ncbi:MAG: TIR domain-containing protein, partial [Pseudonocardiaceae bacterium]
MSTTSAASDEVQNPDNLVELAALERMIRRSNGFRIAFAVANHPMVRDRIIRAARRDLPDLTIAELTIPAGPAGIVAEIETAARSLPDAVFVFGLDELGSDQARSRVIAELNLNRDHLWRAVPVPVVFWASDFAIRQFAQQATDLWSGRSGMYRFRVETDDNAGTITDVISGIAWGTTPDERREREARLRDLLDESGDDAPARARLLVALGDAASAQHRYDEARELYEQALPIHRDIGDQLGEANTLRSLGDTALAQNRYYEARELYEQALPIHRDIGDQLGEANTLRSLGDTALAQNRYDEADEQSFPIQRGTGGAERRLEKPGPAARRGIRVFLSHASQDLPLVRKVHQWLVEDGHEVFLDGHDGATIGEDWKQQLYERLRWADVVVCIVSPASLKSVLNTAEVAIASSLGNRLLPIRTEPGVIHPLLQSVQHIDMARDPMRARADLTEALRRVEAVAGSGWSDDLSPFPGLRPFEVDQHRVFFGRTDEVGQLAGLLRSPALRAESAALLVVGPSGCGKSSLVRAGLLPVMAGEVGWRALPPIMPGTDPVAALTRELTAAGRHVGLGWTVEQVRRQLDSSGLPGLVDELLAADPAGAQRHLLVVVDELEELLTQAAPGQRARFIELLRPALAGPVQLVATLRPEFLDQVLSDPDLATLPTRTFTLRPLRREALRTIIERPARLAGIDVDEHLVARLVDDTDSGEALPLLAFTLAVLAEGVGRGGRLSGTRYEQLGGVQGALTRQADAALADAITTGGRSHDEVIAGLLRLVTVDEQGRPARRRVARDELPDAVPTELDAFIERRLLTTDIDNGTVVLGVAHEAFLSAWPPLAEAIAANVSALRARRAIERAAEEWTDQGRPSTRLWGGGQLSAAVADTGARFRPTPLSVPTRRPTRWWPRRHRVLVTDRVDLSPKAGDFLQTSIRRDRYLRSRAITVLSVLLILAVTAAGVAVAQRQTVQEQQRITIARGLVAQADAVRDIDPGTALRLGIAAERIHPSGETRAGLVNSLTTTRYEHTLISPTGAENGVAFAPDGRTVATAGQDGTVSLWDLTNPAQPSRIGQPLAGHTGAVTSVTFSPDGRTLAAASADQTVRLWDVSDPAQTSLLGQPLTGHTGPVTSAAFSPDGRTLATTSTDKTARLWDVRDPNQPRPLGQPLTGHTDAVTSAAFAPDGRTLATASTDQTVRLWDVSDPNQPRPLGQPLAGHTGAVTSVAFAPNIIVANAPDRRTLATTSTDGTAILWDLTDPAHPRNIGPPLTGHTAAVTSAAFAPDGRTLATASTDQTVRLWDVSDRDRPRPLGPPLTGHTGAVTSVAFAPDGRSLATTSLDGAAIQWNLTNPAQPRRIVRLIGHTAAVAFATFSPDGRILATASTDQTVRLWDVSDRDRPRLLGPPLTGHTGAVTSAAFSPDGRTLATASTDQTTRLWDITNPAQPAQLSSLTSHTGPVNSAT